MRFRLPNGFGPVHPRSRMDTSPRLRMGRWRIKRERKRPTPSSFGLTARASRSARLEIRPPTRALELSPDGKRASVSIPDEAGKGRGYLALRRGARPANALHVWPGRRFWRSGHPMAAASFSPHAGRVPLTCIRRPPAGPAVKRCCWRDNLDKYPMSWSPDGRFVLYESLGSSRSSDLFVLPLTGDRKPFPLLQTQFGESRWTNFSGRPMGRLPFERVW